MSSTEDRALCRVMKLIQEIDELVLRFLVVSSWIKRKQEDD